MKLPSVADVAQALRAVNKYQTEDDPDSEENYIDVRLQVYEDGGWAVRWGLSDYDTDHHGYWGSSSVPSNGKRFDSKSVAKDLIDQVADDVAQQED